MNIYICISLWFYLYGYIWNFNNINNNEWEGRQKSETLLDDGFMAEVISRWIVVNTMHWLRVLIFFFLVFSFVIRDNIVRNRFGVYGGFLHDAQMNISRSFCSLLFLVCHTSCGRTYVLTCLLIIYYPTVFFFWIHCLYCRSLRLIKTSIG